MKKIIKGKLYDTQTGEKVFSYKDDYEYFTLYKTAQGNFFKAGGLQRVKNSSDIIVLSVDDAKTITENFADADIYIKTFSTEEA